MMGDWTFFSNYGHVLVCLERDHSIRLRDVAREVGITERAVQKIVRDMQDAGFITVTKQGRNNRYRINKRKTLRHSLESHCTVGKLLALISKAPAVPAALAKRPAVAAEPDPGSVTKDTMDSPPQAIEIAPEIAPEPSPADPPPKNKKEAKKKEKKSSGPVDVRQQGSLF
jgi:DNA-binding Lrp family transcriptional regulator